MPITETISKSNSALHVRSNRDARSSVAVPVLNLAKLTDQVHFGRATTLAQAKLAIITRNEIEFEQQLATKTLRILQNDVDDQYGYQDVNEIAHLHENADVIRRSPMICLIGKYGTPRMLQALVNTFLDPAPEKTISADQTSTQPTEISRGIYSTRPSVRSEQIQKLTQLFNQTGYNGNNPLHMAVMHPDDTMIQALHYLSIQYGIPIPYNHPNRHGDTPLMTAVKQNRNGQVKVLLEFPYTWPHEKLLFIRNNQGLRPVQLARNSGHQEITLMLIKAEKEVYRKVAMNLLANDKLDESLIPDGRFLRAPQFRIYWDLLRQFEPPAGKQKGQIQPSSQSTAPPLPTEAQTPPRLSNEDERKVKQYVEQRYELQQFIDDHPKLRSFIDNGPFQKSDWWFWLF